MTVPIRAFSGLVYRAHHPMWAHQALSGEGAKKHGGRFNRPGCAALYTSLDITTAWMEAQQGFPFKPQPMTLVAYQVEATAIVDLNDSDTLQCLGISADDLACPWEELAYHKQQPPTWQVVEDLLALGVAGALVRSFASGCTVDQHNLVLWQWQKPDSCQVKLLDDFGRLPKTPASWQDGAT